MSIPWNDHLLKFTLHDPFQTEIGKVSTQVYSLQWRHNGRDSISNLQPHDCLLNRFIQTQIKENIKAPRHWPLCGEFTGDRWIPRTNGQLRGKCFHFMTSSCSFAIYINLHRISLYAHMPSFAWCFHTVSNIGMPNWNNVMLYSRL